MARTRKPQETTASNKTNESAQPASKCLHKIANFAKFI